MSRLLFCLSLLFTYSLSVGSGMLSGDSFAVDTLSVLTGGDGFSDAPDGADADKPTLVSTELSYSYRINNAPAPVRSMAYRHSGSHSVIHPIRAPPV